MKRTIMICAVLITGCASYHAQPLTSEGVDAALRPPAFEALRVDAESLVHPMLAPVEIDEAKGFTPDQLAVIAVLVNPSLRAERDRRQLAQAQLIEAKLLPNPQLTAGVDVPTAGNIADTFVGYGLGLSWDLRELFNPWRAEAAKKEVESVDLDVAYQEWQTAQAAKLAAYRLIGLEMQTALTRDNDRRLRENLRLITLASDKGLMTELDRSAAESASREAHAKVLEAQSEAHQQRLLLNRLLGMPPDRTIAIRSGVELPMHLDPPAAERLLDQLQDNRMDLVALRHGYESQEAAVRSSIFQQFPQINLGLNHARDTSNVITDGPGLTIDLPIFNHNQGQIAMEQATRQKLFDEYTDRVFNARADVVTLLDQIKALNHRIADARAAEPTLRQLVRTYRAAVDHGQADVLSYYAAWNSLNDQLISVLALRQQLVESQIALELASGLTHFDATPPAPAQPPSEKDH
ncbi:MAG: hypothetical protein GC162_20350 [Planctomycetes bacterium]|nr:hypothetical protein [Planctomycetota bacterium]